MTLRIAVVMSLLVSASVFGVAGPADALDGTLRGAEGFSSGSFEKLEASVCNDDGSGEIHYRASNPLSGPLGGTMTTEAVVTLGGDAQNGRNVISAFSGTFTITGGAETITGTLSLAPPRIFTPQGGAEFMNQAYCSGSRDADFQVTARFTASAAGGVFEEGFVKLAGANARSFNPSNLAKAEFWVAPEISIESGHEVDESGLRHNLGGHPLTISVFPTPIDPLEIRVFTSDDTATAGQDYALVDETILIPGDDDDDEWYGFRQTVIVELNDDNQAEGTEEFNAAVELLSGDAFTGTVSTTAQIYDNDSIAVSIADISISEGNPGDRTQLIVEMKPAAPATTSVYACIDIVSGGTATPGSDYWQLLRQERHCQTKAGGFGQVFSLHPGQAASPFFYGQVIGDDVIEDDETIELVVDWVWGATLVGDSTVTITILNDDPGGSPDGDEDGVVDTITGGTTGSFNDGSGTTGQILTGTGVLVEDAPAPDGVRITTTAAATLRVCGSFTMSVAAGSDLVITCGSVTVRVESGSTTIDLGPDGKVTVPAGGLATVNQLENGSYAVENIGEIPLQVTRGGTTVAIAPGAKAFSKPQSKDDCKKGGWLSFGIYRNQGQCVSSVASGK